MGAGTQTKRKSKNRIAMKHPLDKIMDRDKDTVQERIDRNRKATNSIYGSGEAEAEKSDPIEKRLKRNRNERK